MSQQQKRHQSGPTDPRVSKLVAPAVPLAALVVIALVVVLSVLGNGRDDPAEPVPDPPVTPDAVARVHRAVVDLLLGSARPTELREPAQ